MPTMEQVQAAQALYEKALGWQATYELIIEFCARYPKHTYVPLIQVKVGLVNHFYRTRLTAEQRMADHLKGVRSLPACLARGSACAVKKIAETTYGIHPFYSFATKYCHFHNPNAYPMYDKYVRTALGASEACKPIDKWYEGFKTDVKKAIEEAGGGFTFTQMDRYLWLKGQKLQIERNPDKEAELSLEVRLLRRNYADLWSRL